MDNAQARGRFPSAMTGELIMLDVLRYKEVGL
jgi:hypothetical protein